MSPVSALCPNPPGPRPAEPLRRWMAGRRPPRTSPPPSGGRQAPPREGRALVLTACCPGSSPTLKETQTCGLRGEKRLKRVDRSNRISRSSLPPQVQPQAGEGDRSTEAAELGRRLSVWLLTFPWGMDSKAVLHWA